MTKDEARAAGLKRYDATAPCKHGHPSIRYVSNNQCAECARIVESRQRAKDPTAARERRRAWILRNPEKRRAYEATKRGRYNITVRLKNRRAVWKFNGLPTPTRTMPEACECCGKQEPRISDRGHRHFLHLDHCPGSNKFRGWLCNACNLGIGKLGDTVESLERALAYLRRAECPQQTAGIAPEKDGHPGS
jgi:hypothetical protein